MSVFLVYLSILVPVTYINVLFLRWFALKFIYDNPAVMWSGCGMTLIVGTVLLLVVALIAKLITKPFDDIIKKIKTENYQVTDDDVKIGLSSYKKLNILTVCADIFGFFIGQIILVAIGIMNGSNVFYASRVTCIIAQAVGFGLIAMASTITGLDRGLAKHRKLLHIRSMLEYKKQKTMNISNTIGLVVFAIIYFIAMNMFVSPYGLFFNLSLGNEIGNGITQMFQRGAICFIYSLVLSAYPLFVILGHLRKRILSTSNTLEDIAVRGDLSSRIDITMTDDFGILTSSINTMISKLSGMIQNLSEGTNAVSNSAAIISQSAVSASGALVNVSELLGKIHENSNNQNTLIYQADDNISGLVQSVENVKKQVFNQTEAMELISNSITQISDNINSVANTAVQAQKVSDELSKTSLIGTEAVANAINTMEEVTESFDEVQNIVQVIQEIAEQTNLLSMNAAIEAAHAGDVGKGFAVVADQVNTLANSSSESASDIGSKLSELMVNISAGVKAIKAAGQAFEGITEKINENAEMVKNIAKSMEEQRIEANDTQNSAKEILLSVEEIKQLAESETTQAESLREFMHTVVEASKTTETAIQDGLAATSNLQNTIKLVDDSASGNKNVVNEIQTQVAQFKV